MMSSYYFCKEAKEYNKGEKLKAQRSQFLRMYYLYKYTCKVLLPKANQSNNKAQKSSVMKAVNVLRSLVKKEKKKLDNLS